MKLWQDFLFVALGEASLGADEGVVSEVEVLRTGTFVDRNGIEITISEEDIEAYVSNFEGGAAGQEVPIDVKHEKAEAAGWVQGLRKAGNRLLASIEWNALGRQLVGEKVYRYLSASIERAGRVIKTISLVNFPAVKGLRPVELEEGARTFEARPGMAETVREAVRTVLVELGLATEAGGEGGREFEEDEMTPEELKKLKEEIRAELRAELAESQPDRAELEEEVRAELAETIRAEVEAESERRAELEAFAAEVCGSEDVALGYEPGELVELMAGMGEEQVERLQAVLRAKVVEFGERGSSREGREHGEAELPEDITRMARQWVDAGFELEEFFEVNAAELGEMGQYDLSEFEVSEE